MSSFWGPLRSSKYQPKTRETRRTVQISQRCHDLIGFLAICFENLSNESIGLHPVLTNTSPDFEDVSMGGGSFDVRRVRTNTLPHGLDDNLQTAREFIVVKHPLRTEGGIHSANVYADIATELQILRHPSLRNHDNIIRFLSVMYHNAGDIGANEILPALVLEFAEFGSVKTYQENGYGRTVEDKLDILLDAACGLHALHDAGIIHGDLKTSNLLVCKHPTRKFIVKLTDFGYSFTIDEDRMVGLTEHLEAPEALDTLDRRYLYQLDIYSFGLMLYTVFKNGANFFEATDGNQRREQIRALKNTGGLAAITQFNLLFHMASEKCPLLLVCKILAYSLQPDASRRFKSVSRIVQLLRFAKPEPHPDDEGSTRQVPAGGFRRLQESFRNGMKEHVRSYLASLNQNGLCMPMTAVLEIEMPKRINAEVKMYLGDWQSVSESSLVPSSQTAIRAIINVYLGCVPETELAYRSSNDSLREESKAHFRFSTNFMIDLPSISGVFKKMPLPVQESAINCLHQITQQEMDDVDRKANAFFNLAVAYINGNGIRFDLAKAADFLLTAAGLGLQKAQMLYIDIFQGMPGAEVISKAQELEWLKNAVRVGDRRALSRIKSGFTAEIATEKSIFRSTESMGKSSAQCRDQEAVMGGFEPQDWMNWRQMFLRFCVIHELRGLAELLLSYDESLTNKKFPDGETPLLVASRMGDTVMATFLVSEGADPKLKMENGITPLHWLAAFDSADKESIAALYVDHGADLNAMADSTSMSPFRRTVFETAVGGTPLHWAVIENDMSAMDILLSLGADTKVRISGPPPVLGLSCLELAASLSRSAIIRRLLLISSVREEVSQFRRLDQTAPVMVQPLFHVLRTTSRWDRLLLSGADFEQNTLETMQLLIEHGAPTDAVLQIQDSKMPAAFATAFHHCDADIMRAGLKLGFRANIESRFGAISSGGNALMLAITHQDREMFDVLIAAGANVTAVDQYGLGPLHRVAKETDNPYFARKLLAAGVELEPADPSMPSAFNFAVLAGHFKVASFLFEEGANRDRMCSDRPITILGDMLHAHTMNAAKRVEYLLTLPDRGSDGFIAGRFRDWPASVFHLAVSVVTENPADNEITNVMISLLMSKYAGKSFIDNTNGPHHSSVLAQATEIGNYQVVRQLLEAGADPNIQDEYGRTPLDLLYWRYYYPARTDALKELEDISDRLLVGRILRYVNGNTEELLSLLTSYGARTNKFSPPTWASSSPGLRGLDWVIQRLQANRTRQPDWQELQPNPTPFWGGLPIQIPERPMQFEEAPPCNEDEQSH